MKIKHNSTPQISISTPFFSKLTQFFACFSVSFCFLAGTKGLLPRSHFIYLLIVSLEHSILFKLSLFVSFLVVYLFFASDFVSLVLDCQSIILGLPAVFLCPTELCLFLFFYFLSLTPNLCVTLEIFNPAS